MKRRRMSQSERKDQIAGIAARLFSEKGFAGTTVKTIADRARVSEPMVFKLFGSKAGLYRHLIENQEMTALRKKFYAKLVGLAEASDDEGVFRTIAETVIRYHLKDATMARLSLFCALEHHQASKAMFEKHVGAFFDYLAAYIEHRSASGAFQHIDPQLAVRGFMGMLGYFILLRHIFDERGAKHVSARRAADTFTKIFLDGLRKR